GATEVAHVLSTQTLWQRKPRSMRLVFDGVLSAGVTAKDLALYWIAELGNGAAAGHAIEYSGSAITSLSMDARMTLCNLSIEGGARLGMIAPDQVTFDYIQAEMDRAKDHGTQNYAPENIDSAAEDWKLLYSDVDAVFDRELHFDAGKVAPVVSWGISPSQSIAVTDCIPDPAEQELPAAHATRSAIDYMGLVPGQSLEGLPIDQVFLGSCTNGRLEDIRAAATVLKGHRAKVPGLVSPGSSVIKKQAEDEGLHQVFIEAGLTWAESGCSLCVGMNGDTVAAGKRCASTTNRNFRGRQGQGSRTHLMSPAMVAAAAVHGRIVDVRSMAVAGELQP
ncbi:MAG: aconitase family protein, partial [Granulosicoccus sp.]